MTELKFEAGRKNILIIGGGISGLSVLHYLKKRYADSLGVKILLLEKTARLGGTIQTERHQDSIFEYGPNGFLEREETMELAKELGLEGALVTANPETRQKFLLIKDRLHLIPTGIISLWQFQPLSLSDKGRILLELFIQRGDHPEETVYEFGQRRFGEGFSKVFLDPLVTGIYAGDVYRLNMKSAFPRIYETEQKYGSLLKGLIKRPARPSREASGPPRGFSKERLMSFQKGMSQLMDAFCARYQELIRLNQEVHAIRFTGDQFFVHTQDGDHRADCLFLCTPAYAASRIVQSFNPNLSSLLNKIEYAPVAVIGLVYRKDPLARIPNGFGYLVPSSEKKEVLGVLFESQIFPGRSAPPHIVVRVMLGGARYPSILAKTKEELVALAKEEIHARLRIKDEAVFVFTKLWPKAIPQYNSQDLPVRATISKELVNLKGFHLVSNYMDGVSLNDCVRKAKTTVEQIQM